MPFIKNLVRDSILFEIVSKKNRSKPIASFVMTVPPESMEIEEPQRIRTTKTYGGVFVDDYGPDVLKINISGNTGGVDVRQTVIEEGTREFDGRGAFFHFRDTIMRYKSLKSISRTYEDYELRIYDLSTANWKKYAVSAISEGWAEGYVVLLNKFKMTRNKEKPLFYNYTIELTGLRPLGTYSGETSPPTVILNPRTLLDSIRRGINSIQAFFTKVDTVKSKIKSVFDLYDDVSTKLVSFFEQTVDIIVYPLGLCKRFLTATRDLSDTIQDITDTTLSIKGIAIDEYYAMLEITKEIGASVASLVTFGKTPESAGNYTIKTTTEPSKSLSLFERYDDMSDVESEISSEFLGASVVSEEALVVYGYVLVVADASTTLESLAAEYYGDPGLLELIAIFNNFKGDEDIVVGEVVKVPVVLQGGSITDNYVFSENFDDIYGSDIKIDANGDLVISASGDFSIIEGIPNLIRALNSRLNETLGARLRLSVYGIRNAIGGSQNNTAPIAYIISNIKDTAMQDPRINKVWNMKIKGRGDVLDVSFDAGTIKINEVIPFVGSV